MSGSFEALAFNYLSFELFTVVNNIWTWIAVITAAFSFWRIKTSSVKLLATDDDNTSSSQPRTVFVPRSKKVVEVVASTSTTLTSLNKERLTTYYELDDIIGPCMDHYNCGEKRYIDEFKILSQWIHDATFLSDVIEEEEELCEEWYENWEEVIRTRKGEMGWYNYQDLMMIDGNIVRLWEGCRRRREAQATVFLGGIVRTW